MTPPNALLADSPATGPLSAEPPVGLIRESVLVAAGGMVGAVARAVVGAQTAAAPLPFPLATQLVNATGAFALGLLLARLEAGSPRPALRRFLAVGVLGSFTTFSALVDDGRALAAEGSPGSALAFLAPSLAVGLVVFRIGRRIGADGADRTRGSAGAPGPDPRARPGRVSR